MKKSVIKSIKARYDLLKPHLYRCANIGFIYARGFIILMLCLWFGGYVSLLLPITIPASIIGLLTLFFLLNFQLIPTDWIKSSCQILIQYMTLLFIPASMGIMDNYRLLLDNWLPIMVGSLLSSLIVLLFAAFLTEYLHRHSNKASDRQVSKDT